MLAAFNLLLLFLSVYMYNVFGNGTLDRVKLTGKYHVATKELVLPGKGNAITVYYPMDKFDRK